MVSEGWGSDLSQVNIDLPGREMAIVIKPRVGEGVHSWEKLVAMSSVELAEAYELIGICGQHRKVILYKALRKDKSYETMEEIDGDPRAVWFANLYSLGVLLGFLS